MTEPDPTLRPEGRTGALSRTVEAFEQYWDRMMDRVVVAHPTHQDDLVTTHTSRGIGDDGEHGTAQSVFLPSIGHHGGEGGRDRVIQGVIHFSISTRVAGTYAQFENHISRDLLRGLAGRSQGDES